MSDADFKAISDIAYSEAGLVFPPEKAPLVQSRITRRLRQLKITTFSDYTAFVNSEQGLTERKVMISSLTTNVSNFFRESHHFDILREDILPNLLSRARAGDRIRLWSAGCSTGQEPYSIAMTLLDMAPDASTLDVKILATDIDPNVIVTAKRGYYDERAICDIDEALQKKYTETVGNGRKRGFQIKECVRNLISFRELNLLSEWPISGIFDVIFCRNVVIYFDEMTQLSLWPRFEAVTAPGGWLFVGHSERLSDRLDTEFIAAGPTAYQRPSPANTII
ncbi:CheR family methyltransferase [Profundibacter sp.]